MKTRTIGPDRATYRHWLDREARAVIDPASVLRELRRKFGAPSRIVRRSGWTAYTWLSGFDLKTVSIYR